MLRVAFSSSAAYRLASALVAASVVFAALPARAEPNMDRSVDAPAPVKHFTVHGKKTGGSPFAKKSMRPHEGLAEKLGRMFRTMGQEPDLPQVQGDLGGPHSDWINYGF